MILEPPPLAKTPADIPFIDNSDPYKCGALLNGGSWLDPARKWRDMDSFRNWQPPGCMMHEYKKKDIQSCLKSRRLVLIGDSTIRQIYLSIAKKMDSDHAEEIAGLLDPDEKHKDLKFTADGVKVEFIWDPWLNSSGLDHELATFKADPLDVKEANESAALVLLGAPGLWMARHGQENFHKDFKDSIDRIIPYMDHTAFERATLSSSRPLAARERSPNLLLLAPIQVPRYVALSPLRVETITPQKIDQMNDYLQQVSAHSNADVVWSYSLMTWTGRSEYEDSGLHVVDNVALRKADVLLNLRCNADSTKNGFPFNRTCCSNYEKANIVQWILLLATIVTPVAVLYVHKYQFLRLGRFLPASDTLSALSVFGLVVCFCFYADRTQAFEKAQKQFKERDLYRGCFAAAVVGIVSIRRRIDSPKTMKSPEPGFLSRDQTDEWKGWMQAFILIYHYTHASQTIKVYEIVRILVAAYLFMTGFGHTLYFLRTDDYSLRRVASVLIRLNLLSCVLPYMMRTDYLYYYFAPLISFWFLVIYSTLKFGRHRNTSLEFILAKIAVSASLTTAFTMIPGILEFVAFVLKYTCAISWNITEWRFRIFLDMYVVYIGMVLAIFYRQYLFQTTLGHISVRLAKKHSDAFWFVTFFTSLFLLPGFWAFIRDFPDKGSYNKLQPFISFIPILSFITIRNSHVIFRNYYSTAFAWLGRCSLETYILQYHIWLAGDTTGLLRIGIWGRWTEAALLTPLFLWISWCTSQATQKLTIWIVEGSSSSSMNSAKYDDDAKKSHYLPTPSKDLRFEFGRGKAARWLGRAVFAVSKSLRRRLLIIGLLLWLGNILYR